MWSHWFTNPSCCRPCYPDWAERFLLTIRPVPTCCPGRQAVAKSKAWSFRTQFGGGNTVLRPQIQMSLSRPGGVGAVSPGQGRNDRGPGNSQRKCRAPEGSGRCGASNGKSFPPCFRSHPHPSGAHLFHHNFPGPLSFLHCPGLCACPPSGDFCP